MSGCGTKSRYSMEHDVGPSGNFDASDVPDAKPIWEPLSRQGNKSSYVVRGKRYTLADVSNGFQEEGIASWYGLKFHGELTSNGEVYNMYAMSAAHKHLPLPSYVKVTNLDNNKQVVVRVNDRGPFHQGRVIDLSYAAATKLGYANKGTARVRLELINAKPPEDGNIPPYKTDKISYFLQIAAFSAKPSAERLKSQLVNASNIHNAYVATDKTGRAPVHRVRVGPFESKAHADIARKQLKSKGFRNILVIQRALSAKNI